MVYKPLIEDNYETSLVEIAKKLNLSYSQVEDDLESLIKYHYLKFSKNHDYKLDKENRVIINTLAKINEEPVDISKNDVEVVNAKKDSHEKNNNENITNAEKVSTEAVLSKKCPNCGANVDFVNGNNAICSYCESKLTM